MAARSWITVSWVATASNSGVESSTRRRPSSNPAASAVVLTSSNNRRGRSDFRSRASRPAPSGECPPAHHQPRGCLPTQIKRQPVRGHSIRESLIGLKRHHRGHHSRAGTVGRPSIERVNKSAKYSSPNSAGLDNYAGHDAPSNADLVRRGVDLVEHLGHTPSTVAEERRILDVSDSPGQVSTSFAGEFRGGDSLRSAANLCPVTHHSSSYLEPQVFSSLPLAHWYATC